MRGGDAYIGSVLLSRHTRDNNKHPLAATTDTTPVSDKDLTWNPLSTTWLPCTPRTQPRWSWTPNGLHMGTLGRRNSCKCLKYMVARDGIEPPTPAFSGLLTDHAKRFGIKASLCPRAGCRRIDLAGLGLPNRRPPPLRRRDDPRSPLGAQAALLPGGLRGHRRRCRCYPGVPQSRPAFPRRGGHAPGRAGACDALGRFAFKPLRSRDQHPDAAPERVRGDPGFVRAAPSAVRRRPWPPRCAPGGRRRFLVRRMW